VLIDSGVPIVRSPDADGPIKQKEPLFRAMRWGPISQKHQPNTGEASTSKHYANAATRGRTSL